MNTVVFDLGGVVLQWEPHRAYEQVLAPELVGDFMDRIDFAAWNHRHDAGGSFAEGERRLIQAFPDDETAVLAYRRHFEHTLTGMVPGTGALLADLAQAGVRLLALTNWSAETFPYAAQRFGLLRRFAGILVSGAEGLAKPDPAIFRLVADRYGLELSETVFVDDSPPNVSAAGAVGLTGLVFTGADALRAELVGLGLLPPRRPLVEPVYHLADAGSWSQARATGHYPWSTRGITYDAEGFVHCSFAHQVPEVLARHYADAAPGALVLLELDPAHLPGPVVVEDLGAGPYPHLFAALDPYAVTEVTLPAPAS